MHNTSNHLYKYVAELIIDYFNAQKVSPGNRFNLYMEDQGHVEGLYNTISKRDNTEPFHYLHPNGESRYETFYIPIGSTKLILSSSSNASEDYFTMLRNQVANQQGSFSNTAILILFSGKLDSLIGGSGSLSKEGMPLHYLSFKKRLKKDIEESTFEPHEKLVLSRVLDRKTKSVVEDNNSIFDYNDVIQCLVSGKLNHNNYNELGLFPHQELKSIEDVRNQTKLLDLNFELFETMENMHLHGNPEVELERLVTELGKRELLKESWGENDFSQVQKWRDEKKGQKPPIFLDIVKEPEMFQTIWNRSDSSGVSSSRINNILIFNPQSIFPVELELRFDDFLRNDGIDIQRGKGFIKGTTSGYSLRLIINGYDPSNPFSIVRYRDKDTGKLYTFKILQLPSDVALFKKFENNFLISNSKSNPQLLIEEADKLIFNQGFGNEVIEALELDRVYEVPKNQELWLEVDYAAISEDIIPFKLKIDEAEISIAIKSESEPPKPILGIDVWKDKREFETNFRYQKEDDTLKLLFRNNEKTVRGGFRKNLLLEQQIIDSDGYCWEELSDNELRVKEIKLSNDLKLAFNELRLAYKNHKDDLLPSLVFLQDEFKKLAENYVTTFLKELEEIQENHPLNPHQRDLMWLGVVQEEFGEGLIKHSPLHPLNIAYQLSLNERLGKEKIYNAILKRLNPVNLVPFIEHGDKVYTIVDSNDSPEWTYYTEYLESDQAVPKSYVSKLITEKIGDFLHNFEFLFSQSKHSPLILNVINQGDCKEVVQGIFEYYRTYLNKNKTERPSDLIPIIINIYGSAKLVTKFEELTYYDHVEEVEEYIDINLKTNSFEKDDLLHAFLDKIQFYTKSFPKNNEAYDYAHITFYQFNRSEIKRNSNRIEGVKSGISLDGLMSDVPSIPVSETYRSGFGTKHLKSNSNLIDLAISYNALVNASDNGENFERNKAICSTIEFKLKEELDSLYTNSQWVTYIDPKVDLDFFKEKDDLVIIHYSDQYNNSSGYDAITVSNKTNQYSFIVGEFLNKHRVKHDSQKDTLQVINFFNAINGDWLLKLIRQDSQFPREKISLLSGIKAALTFLHHSDIIWVPVSLEEILRVSGSAGLKMAEGPFSAKNLGYENLSYSDDLLLIGLEKSGTRLQMHLLPIELKIGAANLTQKGLEQGQKTFDLLREHLIKDGFLGEFNRNFFAKLALTGAEKMKLYKIWEEQNWERVVSDYRGELLNNQFDVSSRVADEYACFGVIHFGTERVQRKLTIEQNYLLAELLEEDGYNFLVKPISQLVELFHNTPTGIDQENLLKEKVILNNRPDYPTQDSISSEQNKDVGLVSDQSLAAEPKAPYRAADEEEIKKEGIKILFGTNINNQEEIIWEPNNTDKVMHTNTGIIGTMGTGKTQFTKSLITQLTWQANVNIGDESLGILIFDYKGDYIKDDFVNAVDAKVFEPYHLPYNPLALDATLSSKPMLPLHTANDIKETIANAFNLGNVQKQKLRDVIVQAYESKGIDKAKRESWTLASPTMGDVCNIYMSEEGTSQDSLYAAISNLQDFEIFEPDVTKTKSLYNLVEGVTVINLSGYDESIQNLIVAITLDAFYTQMQTHGHSQIEGGKRQIRKMILVDEADNFLSKNFNSIKKILKEGREFGVGTVLSTQFLNHFSTGENDYSNYILTWVIHRVNEIKAKEVDSLFSLNNARQREELIKTIKNLEKHHSIVNLAGSEPIFTKDKAFWELINHQND